MVTGSLEAIMVASKLAVASNQSFVLAPVEREMVAPKLERVAPKLARYSKSINGISLGSSSSFQASTSSYLEPTNNRDNYQARIVSHQ